MSKPRVFVGGISRDTRERDLERFFKDYGHIREVLIKGGYAFVEFEDKEDADDAIYELDGKKLLGQEVSVQRAHGIDRTSRRVNRNNYEKRNKQYGRPQRTKYRVIVKNLSSSVSWQDLKDFMRKAGEVTYGEAHRNRQNQGIVDFSSYAGMKRAIEKLDDTELNGRRIIIQKVKSRSCSSSRSRSRSPLRRSRTHSRSRSSSSSKSRSRSRSEGNSEKRSRSRSASASTSRSRSRSGGRPKRLSKSRSSSRSKSRSCSRSEKKSKKRSRSRSASPSKSRTPKRSKVRSPSKSTSRSKSRDLSRSKSRDLSRSKSRDLSRSKSRDLSRSKSRDLSRSKSRDLSR